MFLEQWSRLNNINTQQLADRIGCSRHAVSYWLAGKTRPSARHTASIIRITGGEVTADDLQRAWQKMRPQT